MNGQVSVGSKIQLLQKLLPKGDVSSSVQAIGEELRIGWPNQEIVICRGGRETVVVLSSGESADDKWICEQILEAGSVRRVVLVVHSGHRAPELVALDGEENFRRFFSFIEFEHPKDTANFLWVLAGLEGFDVITVAGACEDFFKRNGYLNLATAPDREKELWQLVLRNPDSRDVSPRPGWGIRICKTYLPVVRDQVDDRFVWVSGSWISGAAFTLGCKTTLAEVEQEIGRIRNVSAMPAVRRVGVSEYRVD